MFLLLGVCTAAGVIGFLSIETERLSFLPLQIVAFATTLVLLVLNILFRRSMIEA